MLKDIVRALRLPFSSASVLPFIFGSLLACPDFNIFRFVLGLLAALSTHLGANLLNDYADSKSGADWQDRRFYKFFGGSKLIQEGVFSEQFYRNLAILFFLLAGMAVVWLALLLKTLVIIGYYLLILFLGWSYSLKPWQFSYHRLGELIIFVLFGPALVMGGYFIQSGIFPTLKGLLLSLPFGFLTCAILYANEIPDFLEDQKAKKLTWVSLLGQERAFILYYILMTLAFLSIGVGIVLRYLSVLSCFSFILILPALQAAKILKRHYAEKMRLVASAKLTIAVHALVSIILIFDVGT